jgi:hypothetical protein
MALIDKTSIGTGNTIQSEHITRIIDALNESGSYEIIATGSFTGSFTGDGSGLTGVTVTSTPSATSASYATTASHALYAVSASYEINYETSSSYADFAKTASYVKTAQTASYINVSNIAGEIIATTASYVTTAQTASYINATNIDGTVALPSGSILWETGSTGNYSIKLINNSLSDATADYALSAGYNTIASGIASHAEGNSTTASGDYSHAEGYQTIASGDYSHAEGSGSVASGDYSHAEGRQTIASGSTSHAEGLQTLASGLNSHAEGGRTQASGNTSHAEGSYSIASGLTSHAEGSRTEASGLNSHAEGSYSIASGSYSHAGGSKSEARGLASFIHSSASLVTGDNSAVIGGVGITGSADNTVYVPNLVTTGSLTVGGVSTTINGIQRTTYTFTTTDATPYNIFVSDQLSAGTKYIKAIVVARSGTGVGTQSLGGVITKVITLRFTPGGPVYDTNFTDGSISENFTGSPTFTVGFDFCQATGQALTPINWKVIIEYFQL